MMAFLRRLLFYILGIGLGILIVLALFGDRDFDYAYGPQARVKKLFRTKIIDSTSLNHVVLDLSSDSIYYHAVTKGRVDFSESDTRKEPCGTYTLKFKYLETDYRMTIENCSDTVSVLDLTREG
tara:strand:+ start:5089 stop:5460 length:372 start_codon:yes stop_codon:yes gene_type:complete